MATTKFKAQYLSQYIQEIFGSPEQQEPLLTKNLSQKTKFHLKRLGNSLQAEYKQLIEQVRELYDKYSEEYEGEDKKPKKRIKEEFKEQFTKEVEELDDVEVPITHDDFIERDFIDKSTGDIVGGKVYFNLLDILIFEKQDAVTAE